MDIKNRKIFVREFSYRFAKYEDALAVVSFVADKYVDNYGPQIAFGEMDKAMIVDFPKVNSLGEEFIQANTK